MFECTYKCLLSCFHSFLCQGAEQRILEDVAGKTIPLQTILDKKHAFSPEALNRFPEQLVKSSGKMVLIDKVRNLER